MWLHVDMHSRNIVALHEFDFHFCRDIMSDGNIQIARHQYSDINYGAVAVISSADLTHLGDALCGECGFFERFNKLFVKAVRQLMGGIPEDAPAGFDDQ